MERAAASAKVFRALGAAALCLVLAACFVSAKPLIGPEEAVMPLQPGRYVFYEVDEREDPDPVWRGAVGYSASGTLTSPDEGFEYEGARLAVLRPDVWIVQHRPDEGDEGFVYSLLYADPRTEGRYFAELPVCEALSPAVRTSLGLDLVDDACTLDSLGALRDALLAYETERADNLPPFPEGRSYLLREGDL